ncbi:hypothetical protein OG379_00280 [Streptomyces sp. NBC_01166]|uniref:DUF7489 domain-containing protein n=1 Tax=Streptomyces sp. NBC_01166 TaxID=2903755 RepID=UPI00386833EA|nr:hypothetical protein OG379_00280 [Streptomyces sp. NBC_01166]
MSKSQDTGRDDAWEGVVSHRSRGMLDGSNMYHFLEVRLVDGASVKVRVGRRFWKTIAVGDRIAKRPNADPYKA